MGKKEDTPFQASVKEIDTLRKSVDKFMKTSETKIKKKTTDRRELKELHSTCNERITEIESQIQHVTGLEVEDEPSMNEKKFTSKKKDELKKLTTIKEKLSTLEKKLKPDETEEGEMRKEHEDDEETDEEETEDEDESEAEDDETEQAPPKKVSARTPRAEKKKEPVEEVDEESDEEYETDDEDDMTDVTDEEEADSKKPLPQKQEKVSEVRSEGKPLSRAAEVEESEEEEGETEEDEETEYESEEESHAKGASSKKVVEKKVVEEEEESEEETDDDDDEDDDESAGEKPTNRQYEAIEDFEGEEKGDLSFHAGEILTILSARTDGWLEAENSAGKRGLVPITYLRVYNKYKDLEKHEKEDEDEESDEGSELDEGKTPRSGRMLWKNIKQAVKESNLTFLGLVQSTPLIGENCTMKAYLAPKLSPSCLSYRDLFIDNTTNRIRARASRVLRVVQLVSARQIPAPGAGSENKNPKTGQKSDFDEAKGLDIKSRHVRVCLFDGHSMLSNIHTMSVSSVDKDQRTWHFNTKLADNMKSLDFGEFFVRTNTTDTNIGILFELGMSYVRRSNQQSGEFSCGWVFLPLFDKDGKPAEFKSYDEFVNGGTPFEKGVDVDPSVGRRENSSMLRSLVGGNKQPRLNFRILSATKDQKELLDTLPDVLISSTVYIQYLSFYRQILADAVIKDNEDILSCDNIHNGILTTFPAVADQSDLMDVLRQSWAERMKVAKRAEKKDPEVMKEQFKKVFMESVYPLVHATTLPLYKCTEPQVLQTRYAEIKKLTKLNKEKKFVASLLSSDTDLKPFDVSELAFNVIGPHCVAQKHRVH